MNQSINQSTDKEVKILRIWLFQMDFRTQLKKIVKGIEIIDLWKFYALKKMRSDQNIS